MITGVRTVVVFFILLLGLAPSVRAQLPEIRASVIVFGPGPEPHARFGHVALRFQDPSREIDVLFDWGRFDFEFPDFFINYAMGRLDYAMGSADTATYLDAYRAMGRRVEEYVLDLPPDRVQAMLLTCVRTDTDATRYYRYDYYRDNCSTRIRDLIDQAMSGELKQQLSEDSGLTFRSETRRLMPGGLLNWPLAVLIDLAFGPEVDRGNGSWEAAFVPMRLGESLRAATYGGRPLVSEVVELEPGRLPPDRPYPPSFEPGALVFGLVTSAVFWFVRSRRRPFVGSMIAWYGFAAVGSTLLLFLVLISDHAMTRPNANLLIVSPLAWGVLAGLVVGRPGLIRWTTATIAATTGVALLLALAVPGWHWTMFAFLAFAPGNLMLAWLNWGRPTGNSTAPSTITPS